MNCADCGFPYADARFCHECHRRQDDDYFWQINPAEREQVVYRPPVRRSPVRTGLTADPRR